MRIGAWIERLKASSGLDIDARGAASLARAQAGHGRDTVYVVPLSENAPPSGVTGLTRQRATVRVAAVIAVSNLRDESGAAAATELELVRDAVRAAWLGWQPEGAGQPAEYRSGRLLTFADRTVWWQDEYETTYTITQER
ncbi:MAG: hypothetical protein OXH27_10895 [Gammaproteobacteria bacterium]|nr:hypothetical protein [Gammaproteobacteria bacterium]MCY3689256.1 hypothetical protein [Gammaproteobacteria bacterium]MYE30548.1 hypothetical protein [Gammaproteobacteria bacterium]